MVNNPTANLNNEEFARMKVQRARNILNEIAYIRTQLEAIENECKKGIEYDVFDRSYIAEKVGKAQSGLDEISKDIDFNKRRLYL